MNVVEIRKICHKSYPFLDGKELKDGEKLEVLFDDGFTFVGPALVVFDCHGDVKPFLSISYHGKDPWIFLLGMKAKRV